MRVLITGAAGLYGFHALKEMACREDVTKIFGMDDFSRGVPLEEDFAAYPWGEKVQIISQQFQHTTVKELNSLNIDVVVHLAGYNSGKESLNTPEEYFNNNEYGTFKLIETLIHTRNHPFLIYSSTVEVYGDSLYMPVDENHPVNPHNVYAVTKLAAEKHLVAAGRWAHYPGTALRFTNTFGENQNICGYTSVVSSFIDRALRNEPLIVYGTGTQARDFVYVKDTARAIYLAAVFRKSAQGQAINIASGRLLAIRDLAELIIRLTESSSEIIELPCEKDEQDGNLLDIKAAKELLGWAPVYTLEEGLLGTINWHKGLHSI